MAIADQENNTTLGRPVSDSAAHPQRRSGAVASNANLDRRIENKEDDDIDDLIESEYTKEPSNMEYAWLEPRHDPIATDTNLAEIDFEDFRNEDLAYAFSCGVSEQKYM
jgi:hypothetical protein